MLLSSSIKKQILPIYKANLEKTIVWLFKSIEFYVDSVSFDSVMQINSVLIK